jgi:hypothetical protein
MARINGRALEILGTEVQKCAGNDLALQVQREIVLKRLERLRSQDGQLVSYEQMRETVIDFFPNFSDKALKSAAKANRPPGVWSKIKWVTILLAGSAGMVWVANLPYPMVRRPVAKTFPILLLPSYMSMDYNYRQAIALVEQADQLVNQATSVADINLGATKVKEAQKYLNALPVWFLDYEPKYNFWFGWKFTLDEFQAARTKVGRMEAKIFQENQAQKLLEEAEVGLNTAKEQHGKAQTWTERQQAIAAWQTALDQLEQISSETLVGRTSQTKLAAYQRDFQQIASVATASQRTGTLMDAARAFAKNAAIVTQNPPHPFETWKQAEDLWQQSIDRLQNIKVEDAGYLEAQKLLATYQTNLGTIQNRRKTEAASIDALKRAKDQIESWQRINNSAYSSGDSSQKISLLQGIIYQLQEVKPGTTAYSEAQQLLQFAQKRLNQVQSSQTGQSENN